MIIDRSSNIGDHQVNPLIQVAFHFLKINIISFFFRSIFRLLEGLLLRVLLLLHGILELPHLFFHLARHAGNGNDHIKDQPVQAIYNENPDNITQYHKNVKVLKQQKKSVNNL
jgi:hypothetical protein